ncbi:hypothetical protein MMC25_003468 [Agyrium rufum]|nr:hypothetical protein [Agyrium rufum]
MAYVHTDAIEWHDGEKRMHELLQSPREENPTSPFLTPSGAYLLGISPLLAIGTVDSSYRIWTSLWGGEPGFARPLGSSAVGLIGMKTPVDMRYDPVAEALLGHRADGDIVREPGKGAVIAGLAIDLMQRRRVKWAGRLVAGARNWMPESERANGSLADLEGVREAQLIIKIDSSLGNCPKYLNSKQIIPQLLKPSLLSKTLPLPPEAISLLAHADLFFITAAASTDGKSMSTNYRGGPPGFVRVIQNTSEGVFIAYPEYSGNRLYQTLGNLMSPDSGLASHSAGLVFPDFDTGNVLYMTAEAQVLIGSEASALFPRTNLAIKLHILEARFVRCGLSFHGESREPSPYNPRLRYLVSEKSGSVAANVATIQPNARLLNKTPLTPTIAKFRFAIIEEDGRDTQKAKKSNQNIIPRWKPGQHVAFSFATEVGTQGYSHMRDDDPRSLNEDYVRTFTVSSEPAYGDTTVYNGGQGGDATGIAGDEEDTFEITVRNVGRVTDWLFKANPRAGIEVPLLGFSGEFSIVQDVVQEEGEGMLTPFVAGGIGITPLMAQIRTLDLARLRVLWAVRWEDLGLVTEVVGMREGLTKVTTLFITDGTGGGMNHQDEERVLEDLRTKGMTVHLRRIGKDDVQGLAEQTERWYLCSGTGLRKTLLEWLLGKEVVYENFDY